MNKTELENAIEAKKAEIKDKEEEIENFELDPDDYEESYKDALDSEGPVNVAGMQFDASQIIEELDPTAYRCGLNDYVDGLDKDDDPKYKELEEELETLEDELTDLEVELDELEGEE
jgi:predicted  nucleic acid-binding Zn-ribbon protein